MDERTLQALSKVLTLMIFPSSVIEDLYPEDSCLDVVDMMIKLNREINNRFYSLLSVWFNGTDEDANRLERTLNFLAKYYGKDWEKAKRVEILI